MFRPARILVPIEFSDGSRAAVACATTLARELGSRVHLLHVVADPLAQGWGAVAPVGQLADCAAAWHREALSDLEAFARECAGGLDQPRLSVVCSNSPSQAIVAYAGAQRCDLIVMANHRSSALAALLRGSTVERVRRGAQCSVLLVPAADERPELAQLAS